MTKNFTKYIKNPLITLLLSALMALSYTIFVFPCKFAPAGINGIATLLQYLDIVDVSNINIIVNIPLCILAFIFINKEYAINTAVYTASFSVYLKIFEALFKDSSFVFDASSGTGTILATLVAGIISGFIYYQAKVCNGSAGGTQVIAMLIHIKKPQFNMFYSLFFLNASVAVLSFFLLGHKYDPVLLCVLYCFVSSKVGDLLTSGTKKAVRFEIISEECDKISEEIINELHHSATLFEGKGIYSDGKRQMLVCVINNMQVVKMNQIIKRHPGTFASSSEVNEVLGNYKYQVK